MAKNLAGSYFETCSCDVVCPCAASFVLPATNDRCRVVLVFNIKEGDVEGADVGGVKVAGLTHSVRIGDSIDFEVEDVVPAGAQNGQPVRLVGVGHPAGSELGVARATRSSIDAFGIAYEGKSAFTTSDFAWSA